MSYLMFPFVTLRPITHFIRRGMYKRPYVYFVDLPVGPSTAVPGGDAPFAHRPGLPPKTDIWGRKEVHNVLYLYKGTDFYL